jgi:hypothetical protein
MKRYMVLPNPDPYDGEYCRNDSQALWYNLYSYCDARIHGNILLP